MTAKTHRLAFRKGAATLLAWCWLLLAVSGCDLALLDAYNQATVSATRILVTATLTSTLPATSPSHTPTPPPVAVPPTDTPILPALEPLWTFNQVDQTLVRIDPLDNIAGVVIQLRGIITLLDRLEDVTPSDGWLWAGAGQYVVRLDPNLNEVLSVISVRQGRVTRLAGEPGMLWVGVLETAEAGAIPGNDYQPGGGLAWIDPAIDRVEGYTPLGGAVLDMAVLPSSVWLVVSGKEYNLVKVVDTQNHQAATLSSLDLKRMHFNAVAGLGADVWLASVERKAIQLNETTGKVIQVVDLENQTSGEPRAILGAFNAVWVATDNGDILQIDPFAHAVVGKAETGDNLGRLYATTQGIWALSQDTGWVYHIDPRKNNLLAKISTGSQPNPESLQTLSTYTPVPQPTWQPCFDTYPSNLHKGMLAIVKPEPPIPNHVREGPSTEARILGNINPGGKMRILDGPVCADKWIWWKVRVESNELEGWTAEGDGNEYWVVPVQ